MPQRKPPNGSGRPRGGQRPSAAQGRPANARPPAGSSARSPGPGGRPPVRKPGKSIVNQRQTPWTLITVVAVLVLFAGGIVAYAVTRSSDSTPQAAASSGGTAGSTPSSSGGMTASKLDKLYTQPEVAEAKKIPGIIWHIESSHNHVTGTVGYDASPPIGGNHNQYWANCTGTVYTAPIANENAVHMLEHGAIWITYNPKTATTADIAALKAKVEGVDRMAMSPYPGLKTPISLQAWGYQLFLQKAGDARVDQFIGALRYRNGVTPEMSASCSDPYFKASESTPGHPFNG